MTPANIARQKYYVSPQGTIVFHCTACEGSRLINVDSLRNKKHVVKLRCTCGAILLADLEFRGGYRKKVKIPAICTVKENDSRQQFPCTIIDISMGGIAFKLNLPCQIREGHEVQITFNLDDKARTPIARHLQVRHIRQKNVYGCAFIASGSEVMNKAIYFYLK